MTILPLFGGDPRDNLRQFIARMREAAPFGRIDWAATMWDLTGMLTRAGKRLHITTRDVLWFTQRQDEGQPRVGFEAYFDDFAKALICSRHLRSAQTVGAHRVSLRALRYLDEVLRGEGISDLTRVENRHFHEAGEAAVSHEKPSSAYRVGQRLEEIARIIDQKRLGRIRIQFTSTIRKNAGDADATKMPTAEALEALGDVSGARDLYDNEIDLILMRIVDILAATGFRIGEALSLPKNPIVHADGGIGLRFWPEKGGPLRIKSISTTHRELVERAVSDLAKACEDARQVARWCDENPGRAPLPDDVPGIVSTRDIEKLGIVVNAVQWIKNHRVPTFIEGRTMVVTRTDLEAALAKMRAEGPALITGEGQVQRLGDSLIVVFRNELHATGTTNRFVPSMVQWGQVADFLGAKDKHRESATVGSIFKRRNLRDPQGNLHRITSHQFRHWLSTIAKRGGLSEVELARWMGRRRIADNRAYDHRTQEEMVEEARSLIRAGKASGPIAEMYRSLPPVEAEAFLRAQVGSALNTPYGMCVHDYGQGPCERHFSCAGCSELLRRKGDVEERSAIEEMLSRARLSLEAANEEDKDGTCGASNWVARNEQLVIDLITLLAVDDNNSIADGELIKVWPEGRKKAKGFDAA